jgi:parallel beta-helix repeat protein
MTSRNRLQPCLEPLEPRELPSVGPLAWLGMLQQSASLAGLPTLPPVQTAPTVEVHPGDSIQAAIDAAAPGTVIVLDPGTYAQAVTVSTPDLFLVGRSGPGAVKLTNPGGANNGVTVNPGGGGFGLVGVGVEGFAKNGVLLKGVQRFALLDVNAGHDGAYGLFPVGSSGGLIAGCTATGNDDTGIYVGQSVGVAVLGDTVHGNVNGIEIENTVGALVAANAAFDNTVGVLVDLLPGLGFPFAAGILVADNLALANNHANFGAPGDIASAEPSGVGIFILGADATAVSHNLVLGNGTLGIGVGSSALLDLLAGTGPSGIPDIPIATRVHGNFIFGGPFGADLFWDGLGVDNFWSGNTFQTELSLRPLPAG